MSQIVPNDFSAYGVEGRRIQDLAVQIKETADRNERVRNEYINAKRSWNSDFQFSRNNPNYRLRPQPEKPKKRTVNEQKHKEDFYRRAQGGGNTTGLEYFDFYDEVEFNDWPEDLFKLETVNPGSTGNASMPIGDEDPGTGAGYFYDAGGENFQEGATFQKFGVTWTKIKLPRTHFDGRPQYRWRQEGVGDPKAIK